MLKCIFMLNTIFMLMGYGFKNKAIHCMYITVYGVRSESHKVITECTLLYLEW